MPEEEHRARQDALFEPPWVETGSEVVVEPGMCLAAERRIEAPGAGGAQYEDDVLVTEAGPQVLTA